MPFTLAHPAAVLPLRGIRFLRTVPLVIGAVTPDVPYYLPLGPSGRPMRVGLDTHSLAPPPPGPAAPPTRVGPATHSLTGACTVALAPGMVLLAVAVLLREPL